MNKVWLVTTEWVEESLLGNGGITRVFSSYEKAKQVFNELVEEDKKDNFGGVYNIEDSEYEWEEDKTHWSIWRSGYYNSDHSNITIEELELE